MKFEIAELSALRIVNVNPRTEEHGDALVPAVDVKLEWETTSAVLDRFHPELRAALYWANDAARAQDSVEGVDPISGNLIFPDLDALRWKAKPEAAYRFAIELPSLAPVVLAPCKVNGFALDPREGGSMLVSLRVQCSPVGEREVGKLATMIGARVLATLTLVLDEPAAATPSEAGAPGDTLAETPNLSAWPFGVAPEQIPASARPTQHKGNRRTNRIEREAELRDAATAAFLAEHDEGRDADTIGH